MPLKVWDGSAWKMAGQIKVWNGSSWGQTTAGKVWNGSSWVQFHPGAQLVEYNGTGVVDLYHSIVFSVSGDYAEVGITLNSSGAASYWYEDSYTSRTDFFSSAYNWLLTGANSDYYAFMDTPSSGSFRAGSAATNSALQLNTTRTWSIRQTNGGLNQVQSTIRIQTPSGLDIASLTVNLAAEVTL
jgi:hypothetical protein